MSKVLMIASEAMPFSKTGGLADVAGALPAALAAQGDEVAVVTPLYGPAKSIPADAPKVWDGYRVWLGPAYIDADVRKLVKDNVTWFLIECPSAFDRKSIYGELDDHLRFAVLCHAALGVVRRLFRPQVMHLHDWQTGLIPPLMRRQFAGDPTFYGIKLLFTIHNLGYQGIFSRAQFNQLGLNQSLFHPAALEFFGDMNWMKGGIVFSDAISTVSRRYAEEIQTPEYGFGLDSLLRSRAGVLTGIVNGVDYRDWSPETDSYLAANYSVDDLSGKRECKRDLLHEFGLPPENMERPLIGIVSRFATQKGFDLIAEVAEELMAEDLALIVLGTGEAQYEALFRELAAAHPNRVAVRVTYNNEWAHKIEAGSDMFLMPSRYEPCGLNQIYSLRYGTPPIVRATGGLDDTIEEETGFKFQEYSGTALLQAIRAALTAWKDKESWSGLIQRGMKKDFSWDASAAEYSKLYRELIRQG